MSETPIAKNEFLTELNAIVEQNMANEQFGVSELADAMNMSRSNLLRKVKKETNLSVSQHISQVRLTRAMELLKTTSLNVSEVSHQVGFNSPSYFIKCFREHYGYPPGEIGKRPPEEILESEVVPPSVNSKRKFILIGIAATMLIGAGVTWFLMRSSFAKAKSIEKSIVILPFKNESNDSTNVYLINGLMEATLNNLQQMKELKVISRTSAEKYRNTTKSIPEIAKELNVSYFVEGSGQKIGDQILLNIQLIDATTDNHLWAKQYRRETREIFELQKEIARNIADEIEVIISPEENERLEMKPTDNLVAYDAYLKGSDLFYKSKGGADLLAAVSWFKKAIEEDPEFGLAYANLGIVYYYLDIFQIEKKYALKLSTNADKALLYAPKSDVSLIVKALDYASKRQFKQAVPYFEKALEYNPNSGLVLHFLNEFYSMHVPNPAKHLEIALRRVKNDVPMLDSNTTAFNYFHLSNALFENGFLDEATVYINKSMAYNPNGFFTAYFRVYVLTMKDHNLSRTKAMMLEVLKKDTSRFDIVQEMGKICFMMRDYDEAFKYYKWFVKSRDRMHLNLYKYEDLRVAIVYEKMGLKPEAPKFIASFNDYVDNDLTVYKNLHLAMYWCYRGDKRKALDHLKLFANEKTITYAVTYLGDDPLLDQISSLPEFKSIMAEIKTTFDKTHNQLAEMLKEEKLP
ncbi:MAG: helix-turn-helix domain-containing protein [Cyclobacteriaceae bacterium]